MKSNKIFWMIMIMAAVVAMPAYGADIAKIGVVDFQKILTESEAGKAVQEKIQKRGREMETSLKDIGSQIEALNDQLSREAMVMSKEKRDEKQRELEIKKYDFQSMQKKFQAEFRDMEGQMIDKLQKEILALAEQIGKKEGYLLIIEKSAVVYYPSTIDLTDQLIEQYNASHPKP